MSALLIILALAVFAVIALRYGADSRDGTADWSLPGQGPVAHH
jgi:hypothetical protein